MLPVQISQLDKTKLPRHVAIIMDGNGRWAKQNGLARVDGHRRGADVVDDITEMSREVGIKYLTLYAFSKENWNRPIEEVRALMDLLKEFLTKKEAKLLQNGIRLNAIGDLDALPREVLDLLNQVKHKTSVGCEMVLTLALGYGARDEILRAIKKFGDDLTQGKLSQDHLDEAAFAEYLDTRDLPDPDLVIRTSGENRISNFLLWQAAYAEFSFVKPAWPEFSRELFLQCLLDYQKRERRFGKISEQLD